MRVTSKFTYKRWHPLLHRYRPHLGIDFGAPTGMPIHSIASGKVVYAGWMGGYGRVVKIDHGSGYLSLYAHQSKILVKKGQYVKSWQVIGKVGSSGRSTAHHLHLGVYKRGKPINPNRVLRHIVKVRDGIRRVKKSIKIVTNLSKELPNRAKIVYNSIKKLNSHIFKWKNLDSTINIVITNREKEAKHAARVQLPNREGDVRLFN